MNPKKVYGIFLLKMAQMLGVDFAKKFDAWFRFGRRLNLKHPKTLADKVSYLELHKQSPIASMCTDKFEVRKYISDKGYGDILVPILGGPWVCIDEIDFTALPSSYVFKATHGCKMNFIVPDAATFDEHKCRQEMKRWLSTTYGIYSMEPHYAKIPHRIYAEEYLGNMANLPDYKFHCLNGIPQFVLVVSNRVTNGDKAMSATKDIFDMQWNPIFEIVPHGKDVPGEGTVAKPQCFAKMIEIARALSEDFDFVRVDLYEKDGKVFFGELTFSPATGVFPSFSEKFIAEMGAKLKIQI